MQGAERARRSRKLDPLRTDPRSTSSLIDQRRTVAARRGSCALMQLHYAVRAPRAKQRSLRAHQRRRAWRPERERRGGVRSRLSLQVFHREQKCDERNVSRLGKRASCKPAIDRPAWQPRCGLRPPRLHQAGLPRTRATADRVRRDAVVDEVTARRNFANQSPGDVRASISVMICPFGSRRSSR